MATTKGFREQLFVTGWPECTTSWVGAVPVGEVKGGFGGGAKVIWIGSPGRRRGHDLSGFHMRCPSMTPPTPSWIWLAEPLSVLYPQWLNLKSGQAMLMQVYQDSDQALSLVAHISTCHHSQRRWRSISALSRNIKYTALLIVIVYLWVTKFPELYWHGNAAALTGATL